MRFKWVLIWTLLHAFSFLIISYLIDLLNLQSQFVELLFLGFGVTILANIYRTFTRKGKFIINSLFAFWIAINLVAIALFGFISSSLGVNDIYINALVIGIGLVAASYLVQALRLLRLRCYKRWISVIIILGALFVMCGGMDLIPSYEGSDVKKSISGITDDIKEKVSEISEDIDPTSLKNVKITFEELNDLRAEKGLRKLEWDDRAYEMAISRSKDMEDRNYFSHLTPEGECMYTLKSQYGFGSGETVAENIWMISSGGADPDEALTSWIGSPGHYANLFYADHVAGAIGCYGNYCVFNGINNDPYGLGNAPCSMYDY